MHTYITQVTLKIKKILMQYSKVLFFIFLMNDA